MKKVGRKPWTPDLEKIEHLASRGLTLQQIAHAVGISKSTLFEKMRQLPELKDTIKRGASSSLEQVGNKLIEAALNGNVTAMIFFLKCRGGWKEGDAPSLELPNELFSVLFEDSD